MYSTSLRGNVKDYLKSFQKRYRRFYRTDKYKHSLPDNKLVFFIQQAK